MSLNEVKLTSLWKKAFEECSIQEESPTKKLEIELLGFRSRAHDLVGKIQTSLPDLTIHDGTHLDALWSVASLIAGDDYPLNPLESFVFGGAVLLHDSALCIEAYEGGRAGLRNTPIWADTKILEQERRPSASEQEIENICDFSAMRALHAHRAEQLAQYSWKSSNTNTPHFLISDITLRNHVGNLIGQIASSHHWSIEEVAEKLDRPLNPPAGYPISWQIDAIKIACLLRTADAAHFCQDRAPDFLLALNSRSGTSAAHWTAQNRITGPALDPADSTRESILYTSTSNFPESETSSWWVAYDALSVVQKEITDANALLKKRAYLSAPQLKIKRVSGAASVAECAKYIRSENWEPSDVKIRISEVESLIRNLGGEKLYGVTEPKDKLYVVLRELIQNARDAVVARRTLYSEYVGQINVRIFEENGHQFLQVEDDGIGMSKRVLTGPFLDFGNSFWSSDLVKEELPGLKKRKYRSVGKFGVGFYSAFMIASRADVSSKRWDAGIPDVLQLIFSSGLSMRPTIKFGSPKHHSWQSSTVIRLQLLDECTIKDINAVTIASGFVGIDDFVVPFENLLKSWVVGLDVAVAFSAAGEQLKIIHGGAPGYDPTSEEILRRVSFPEFRDSLKETIENEINTVVGRMRPVGDSKYGIAAIQESLHASLMLGAKCIGGFRPNVMNGDQKFAGFIECDPDSASRGAGHFSAPPEVISKWVDEQIELFEQTNPNDLKRATFAESLAAFDHDPISVAKILVQSSDQNIFVDFQQLANLAEKFPIVFAESAFAQHVDVNAKLTALPNSLVVRCLANGKFCSLERVGARPLKPYSLLGCLSRAIEKSGKTMSFVDIAHSFESPIFGTARAIAVMAVSKI